MKICATCKVPKEHSEFRKRAIKEDGLDIDCKECRRKKDKEIYNKDLNQSRISGLLYKTLAREKKQDYVIKYLSTHPCIDCGENDPIVLEFDHQKDKQYNISFLLRDHSLEKLKKEIEKCEVRCANCHRRKTATQRNYYKLRGGGI